MPERPIRRALLSVWDKSGLVELASTLAALKVELISTGGTATQLRDAGLTVRDVSEVTGMPGILDGRVKTLHPAVHGGILARRDLEAHMSTIEALGIPPIDLVVVNLYPFVATIAAGAAAGDAIEMIDIGGVAVIRAAAKNHDSVTVVTDPADYAAVVAAMAGQPGRPSGCVGEELRRRLAAKAFARTAAYDAAIASWFAGREGDAPPERLTITAERRQLMRYGENPHQQAALYVPAGGLGGVAQASQVQGKALSYNNLADADAAFALVADLDAPAVAIIKHANPAGVAIADDLAAAYDKALACDPISAYGGIVAVNRTLDLAVALRIVAIFTEVVIAPDADPAARAALARKPNLRLLLTGPEGALIVNPWQLRSITGGLLVQEADDRMIGADDLRVVTARAPSAAELADLRFAFTVAKHVKSNAIVLAKNGATVGIGAGQMSRLDSVRLAVDKAAAAARDAGEAGPRAAGAVLASDAFFPFPDGLEAALAAGVTAVIQPGGSMRDEAVIAAADQAGATMLLTGVRHFRH